MISKITPFTRCKTFSFKSNIRLVNCSNNEDYWNFFPPIGLIMSGKKWKFITKKMYRLHVWQPLKANVYYRVAIFLSQRGCCSLIILRWRDCWSSYLCVRAYMCVAIIELKLISPFLHVIKIRYSLLEKKLIKNIFLICGGETSCSLCINSPIFNIKYLRHIFVWQKELIE